MNPTKPANSGPAPVTSPPAAIPPAPTSATPAQLTDGQIKDLEWLAEVGSNIAILHSSIHPTLKQRGMDMAPLLDLEWKRRFPGLDAENTQTRRDNTTKFRASMDKNGPPIWTTFHTRTYPKDAATEMTWLRETFRALISCPVCQVGYDAILRKLPPALGSADDYFAWRVQVHNEVSAKLNAERPNEAPKPILTVDAAREIWAHSTGSGPAAPK